MQPGKTVRCVNLPCQVTVYIEEEEFRRTPDEALIGIALGRLYRLQADYVHGDLSALKTIQIHTTRLKEPFVTEIYRGAK